MSKCPVTNASAFVLLSGSAIAYLLRKQRTLRAAATTGSATPSTTPKSTAAPSAVSTGAGSGAGNGSGDTGANKWKFYPSDFATLEFRPLHLDLTLDIKEERVVVTLKATYRNESGSEKSFVELDCADLKVNRVQVYAYAKVACHTGRANFEEHVASLTGAEDARFELLADENKLRVHFPTPVVDGAQVSIFTETVCNPTEHILEGIYLDHQHKDSPRNLISQCQQYGFQRIAPTVDRMAAKTFYTTTLIADKRYTNIITNGDLAPGFYDPETMRPTPQASGTVLAAEDPTRHVLRYHNHKVNMSPYLFFVGCGVFDTYRKTVEYPDGDTFVLELLLLPGQCSHSDAVVAINAVHDSILWTYTSTGPETYDHNVEREEINALLGERQALLEDNRSTVSLNEEQPHPGTARAGDAARLAEIRARLKELIAVWKDTGYKYTGQVYREIAMENSDYGGMENVGNTTVIASRIAPSPHLDDPGYMYMEGVKVHEYYHNINGSQVTGLSPFQIWLNEAVTVHIQRKREHQLFDDDFRRLYEVLINLRPGSGPLAADASSVAMPIEPEGFNRTQELISMMTYMKAPEFVRMMETLLTPRVFVRGLHHYHTKFANSNADTMDWIESMEAVSGLELKSMAKGWLQRSGHPTVSYTSSYDATSHEYTVKVTQTGFEKSASGNTAPWEFPIDWALVRRGAVTHSGVWRMARAEQTFVIAGVAQAPDFLSFARQWSFFGRINRGNDVAVLVKQAMSDPDVPNRFFAFNALALKEKISLVEKLAAGAKPGSASLSVSKTFLELHRTILRDDKLSLGSRAMMIRNPSGVGTRDDLAHLYDHIHTANRIISQAVYDHHGDVVLHMMREINASADPDAPQAVGVNSRFMIPMLLSILAAGVSTEAAAPRNPLAHVEAAEFDKAQLQELVAELAESPFMNNRVVALRYSLCLCPDDERRAMLAAVTEKWTSHNVATQAFISVVTSLDVDNAPEIIRDVMAAPYFKLAQAGHARTLIRGWTSVRHRCLLTDAGLELLIEVTAKVGKVNQMSAADSISAFSDLDKFTGAAQERLVAALKKLLGMLDAKEQSSLVHRINTLLASL